MGDDGKLEKSGVPAALVNAWFTEFRAVHTQLLFTRTNMTTATAGPIAAQTSERPKTLKGTMDDS